MGCAGPPGEAEPFVWLPGPVELAPALRSVCGAADRVLAVGGTLDRGTALEYTGRRWIEQPLPAAPPLAFCWGDPGGTVIAVAAGPTILRRREGRWRLDDATPIGADIALAAVWGAQFDDLWAVGGDAAGAVIAHGDGGAWTRAEIEDDLPALAGVSGSAGDDVWAVGTAGTIAHYDGATWRAVDSGTSADLSAVWAVARDEAYAVGADGDTGVVLSWDGAAWSPFATAPEALAAIWTSPARGLYVAGARGLLLRFARFGGRPDPRRTAFAGVDDTLTVLGLFGREVDPFVVAAVSDPAATAPPFRGGVIGHRISLSDAISTPNPPDAGP